MKKNKKKTMICILGASFETKNMGVSALADSLITNLLDSIPGAEIKNIIGNKIPKITYFEYKGNNIPIEIMNYRLSPKAKFNEHLIYILLCALIYKYIPIYKKIIVNTVPILKTIIESDLIGHIHGGDSFSDIYGVGRYCKEIVMDMVCVLVGTNYILLPQTYGPYDHTVSKIMSRWIFRNSKKVFSRDKYGIEMVQNILNKSSHDDKIIFCPDVAFTLKGSRPKHIEMMPVLDLQNHKPIGININGLMFYGGYTRNNMFNLILDYRQFCHELIMYFLKNTREHILLIPHTYGERFQVNSDNNAISEVITFFTDKSDDRIHTINTRLNQRELKWVIGKCNFFVGSRMHSCIAALSQNIPTIGVAYSRKFKGVFNSINADQMVLDGRSYSTGEMIKRINQIYLDSKNTCLLQKQSVNNAKDRVKKIFKNILA